MVLLFKEAIFLLNVIMLISVADAKYDTCTCPNEFSEINKVLVELTNEISIIKQGVQLLESHLIKKCDEGWNQYEGHCYFLSVEKRNWHNAQIACTKHGANLVTIKDEKENNWLKALIQDRDAGLVWFGLFLSKTGEWRWESDNSVAEFTDWHPHEPRDDRCGEFWNASGVDKWDDTPCSGKHQYICEK